MGSQNRTKNLFSMIRGKNPVPTPKEFKSALRMISAAQYFKPNKNGNFEAEDTVFLFKYLKTRQSSSTKIDLPDFTYGSSLCDENVSPNQFIENNVSPENSSSRNTTDVSTSIYMDLELIGSVLSEEEGQSLYKLSGAVVQTVINRHRIRCETCKSALLKSTSCDISRAQILTNLSNYSRPDTFDKNSGLIFSSELVYCFLQNAEFIFRKREEEILSGVVTFSEMLETLLPLCITYKFPPCHSVGKHILKAYLFSRIHFIVRKFNNTIVCNKSSKCGSKSVGMRNAVNK
ncbi:uncharacterized protein LOC143894322 isoform X1 [Temnothorax americanus]|uniref:uncharacterized protein LOC143894322 isoform X1 n=1 Tax=Temnothorax americanus TaxID=1964332 RepID=UPI004067DDFA